MGLVCRDLVLRFGSFGGYRFYVLVGVFGLLVLSWDVGRVGIGFGWWKLLVGELDFGKFIFIKILVRSFFFYVNGLRVFVLFLRFIIGDLLKLVEKFEYVGFSLE